MIEYRAMIPSARLFTFIAVALGALALAGCGSVAGGGYGAFGASGEAAVPKTFVVSDFVFSKDVTALDRSYTARLERKIGSFPTHERKPRTIERVNDEIVAVIIATLQEAGLRAEPGREEALTLKDDAVLITGRLHAAAQAKPAKDKQIGFGADHGGVAAEIAVSRFSAGGKTPLLEFSAQAPTGRAVALDRKQAAARNAAIDAALAAEGTPAVKLSADTEEQARRLGRALGERIVAIAKERGWLAKADAGGTMPAQQPVTAPPSRPAKPTT